MTFSTVSLRPYQSQCIERLAKQIARHRKVVLQVPTGGGKTRIATAIIQRALSKGNPVLFICDREELIDQTSIAFDAAGIPHGVIQGNHWRYEPHQPVQVATAQTLRRRKWPDCRLVIWDECHTVYQNILKKMDQWDAIKFIGLTATPLTKGMGKHWDHLVVGATTRELIDAKWLCDYTVFGPPIDLSAVRVVAGEYHEGELSEVVNQKTIVGDVVRTWLSLGENRQTICFAVNVAHSKHLAAEFRSYGISAAHIDAYTDSDERKQALTDFASGAVKVICSVDILTKGYDQPQASCLIMARPTKSRTVYLQQAGRVLRIAEGKRDAIILDHGGNCERHGFPCDPLPGVLCDGKKATSKTSEPKEKLPKPCPKCHFMKPPGVHECPSCQFKPERATEVENTEDKLVRIEKVNTAEKMRWYAMLLHYRQHTKPHYKRGWPSAVYKKKFGVWPHRKDGVVPIPPDEEVLNYIKHLQIRHAKSSRPVATECRYCNSGNLVKGEGKGPHAAQLRCGDCGKHVQWLSKEQA